MTKLKNPLFSLEAVRRLGSALTFRRSRGQNIAELPPIPVDVQSLAQLSWRHMYQKATALWHALNPAEKQDWESQARRRHMTGYAWFMSQALKPNPGLYLPLQGGTMSGNIDMAKNRLLKLPAPTDPQEAARLADLVGVTTFLALTDTPANYVGDALKVLRVNAGQNAVEFATITGGYTEGARVRHNANQAIPHNVWTILAFNQERYDTDTIHDNVVNNSRLTCKTPGVYVITFVFSWVANATGWRLAYFYLNASTYIAIVAWDAVATDQTRMSMTTIYKLALNDFVEAGVYQNSGGALNVNSNTFYSPAFAMQRIG